MNNSNISILNIESIKNVLIPIFIQYGITKSAIFGSFARGEQTESSDVDILFSIRNGMPLSQWSEMEEKIESSIGRHVDMIEFGSLPKRVENEILKEAVTIFEQKG